MMFCPDCESSLDTVPGGEPCPTCGGTRREAIVSPELTSTVAVVEEVSYVITRGDQRPWSEKWQRILRGRDAISEAYAAEGRALGNLEVEGRVTSFFSDCYHLRDWLIGDRGSMPGVTPAGVDEYIRNSYPLSLSQAICNTDKHHTRSRGVTARIRKTVVSPRGARVTLEIDWATPQAAEIDALDLANDCVRAWREFFDRFEIEEPS